MQYEFLWLLQFKKVHALSGSGFSALTYKHSQCTEGTFYMIVLNFFYKYLLRDEATFAVYHDFNEDLLLVVLDE